MHSVMKCWWALSILHLSHGLVHGDMPLDGGQPSHRRLEPSYISEIADTVEQLMIDAQSYDEDTSQEMTEALQLQSRTMRSPRRCVPHQQSCLGHQLPCCDPCDTCYCRFFNAICYCRRVGQSCSHRHT
ncbi:agouti-related protein [Gadus chalcogrammus]|uniref:Agouti-related protein n=1 Tax=Gadus morhua TaxID=8049 RepID=J3A6E5_GADMO|nr:agouti-related protein [Gadus chalcogrammus]FAA00762.1 TPA: Agouti-related peptide 1 [Gadus morhua]